MVVPLVEIYVLIQVGQVIGAWWTILLLVLDSIFGSWLIRREGGRAWQALRTALEHRPDAGPRAGRRRADPGRRHADAQPRASSPTPSGILLILPFTRPVARRLLTRVVSKRLVAGSSTTHGPPRTWRSGGPVVRGEVVDE